MSVARAAASHLKPEIRLAQAVSHFEADLSNEHKATFRAYKSQSLHSPPDISDVMRLSAEIDARASQKRAGRRCFGPRFTNFLEAVQQFAALGDVIVGGSQNIIACGVWSLVRTTLLLIANFSSYLDKWSMLFMTVGRSAPCYKAMGLLYPRSSSLQSHLCEYFIVVVHLCHELLKFTQRSALAQLTSSLKDADVKKYETELNLWSNSIKEDVSLLMAQKIEEEALENSRFRFIAKSTSELDKYRKRLKTKLRVLDICSEYNYETSWKHLQKLGHATIFSQSTDYMRWRRREEASTLIFTGKLGCGKSVLLANIVNDLNLHVQSATGTVAYFFCRYDINESLKARTVIGALARQILLSFSDLGMVTDRLNQSPALDCDGLIGLLQGIIPSGFKAFFVLDGLDECEDVERQAMIQSLRKLQETFVLCLCVSSRLEADYSWRQVAEQFVNCNIISIPDDNPDIEGFIGAELESCIESGKLRIGNPVLALEIHDALLAGAQGMFLWVALQIKSLCSEKTDEAIRHALAHLPKDLSETFSRILQRSASDTVERSYQRRVLQLIVAARRPLTTAELREALSVVPGDIVWNQARLINDIYSTLALCGSLITIDEEELTVQLVHHSVKQFLNVFKDWNGGQPFSIARANNTMADIIVTYLSYGIFETQLSTVVVPQIPASSAPYKIVHSSLDSSSHVRSFALWLLRSRNQPNFNMGETLTQASRHSRPDSGDEHCFYPYADSYWLEYIWYVSDHLRNLQLQIFTKKALRTDTANKDAENLLVCAVIKGCEPLVELLLNERTNPNCIPTTGPRYPPLWWAATKWYAAEVDRQLELDKISTYPEDAANKLLLLPVDWRKYEAVVTALLKHGADPRLELANGRSLLDSIEEELSSSIVTYPPPVNVFSTQLTAKDDVVEYLARGCHSMAFMTLTGPSKLVRAVAFSPNGEDVAAASDDNKVWLWNIRTGDIKRIFFGHTDYVLGVAFSPNGLQLTSASKDRSLRLWDSLTGETQRQLLGHSSWIWGVTFSPRGTLIASASEDRTVRIWSAVGVEKHILAGHTSSVLTVAFSPDGSLIATGSKDTTVRIWDVHSGDAIQVLQGHGDWVSAVAFSPDGKKIASASKDQTIRIWTIGTTASSLILHGHTDWIQAVAFSPNGQWVASGSKDKTVWLWDTKTWQIAQVFPGHKDWIYSVAFSADSTTVASASKDQTVKLWTI